MRLAMNFYFYFYFITSLIASLLLFLTYAKIATKLSIIDKTNNFNNPETVTSGGLVIFLNLIIGFFYGESLNGGAYGDWVGAYLNPIETNRQTDLFKKT